MKVERERERCPYDHPCNVLSIKSVGGRGVRDLPYIWHRVIVMDVIRGLAGRGEASAPLEERAPCCRCGKWPN